MRPLIRLASSTDKPAILGLLVELATTSRYTGREPLNEGHLATSLDQLMENPNAGFLMASVGEATVGLLVLLLYDDLISGERKAAEVCWFVQPAHRRGTGLHLLDRGESWAIEHGARQLEMLAPDYRFQRAYRRRGFTPTNRVCVKRL